MPPTAAVTSLGANARSACSEPLGNSMLIGSRVRTTPGLLRPRFLYAFMAQCLRNSSRARELLSRGPRSENPRPSLGSLWHTPAREPNLVPEDRSVPPAASTFLASRAVGHVPRVGEVTGGLTPRRHTAPIRIAAAAMIRAMSATITSGETLSLEQKRPIFSRQGIPTLVCSS